MKPEIQRAPLMAACVVAFAACSTQVSSGAAPGDGGSTADATTTTTTTTGDTATTATTGAGGAGGAQATSASVGTGDPVGVGGAVGAGGSVAAGGSGVGASAPMWAVTGVGVTPTAMGTSDAGVTTVMGLVDTTATDFGGPLPCTITTTTMFLASFDASGNRLWFECFEQPFVGQALAVGPNGDLAFTGTVQQAVDFGTGTLEPVTSGWVPFAVVGLDASGTVRFALEVPGDNPVALAVDAAGDVSAVGSSTGHDFGTGSRVAAGMWVAAWDEGGAPLHAWKAGPSFYEPSSIAVDASGDAAIAGLIAPLQGDPSAPVQGEPFVLELDPAGHVDWTLVGTPVHPHASVPPAGKALAVTFGSQGDVFAAGQVTGRIDFGLGTLPQPSHGASCNFVIDARAGAPVWQDVLVGASASSVAANEAGGFLVGGTSGAHAVVAGQPIHGASGELAFGFLADFDSAGHPSNLAPIDAAFAIDSVAAAFGPGFRVAAGSMQGNLLTAGQSGGNASGGYLIAFPE